MLKSCAILVTRHLATVAEEMQEWDVTGEMYSVHPQLHVHLLFIHALSLKKCGNKIILQQVSATCNEWKDDPDSEPEPC